ncbi:protein kinase [Streptomyces sp. FXJ1.4098]|nr:protein kinase [Streptomyces sp. FXJ1.4098]
MAVKVIRPEHAEDPRFRRRFEREVEVVRRVHGKYTAGLVASGFDEEERLWMATAYVPGPGLDDTVRRFGPFPAPVVWRLAGEIGEALATLAAAGIVHRDLKPSNVLLGADGARVIDFGVAHTTDASVLTMTGQHVGTPAFMSPSRPTAGRRAPPRTSSRSARCSHTRRPAERRSARVRRPMSSTAWSTRRRVRMCWPR